MISLSTSSSGIGISETVVEQVVEQYLHRQHRQKRQDQRRPGHREHVPEIRARRHHDIFHDVAEGAAAFDDAALQHAEILLQQNDVGRVLGDIDRAIDRDADIGGVQRRRIVDAVAEIADDVAAALQPKNDAVLLNGRDPAEQVRLFQPRGERLVAERFDLGAGQQPGDRNAELGADMLRHALVVAAEDLDADTLGPERGDGRPGARFGGSKKTTKPANTNSCSSATAARLRSGSSSRQATPRARNPSALSPSKTFAARARAASSSGRSSGLPGSSYRTGEPDDVFGRALGNQQAAALVLDEHRNAAPLKVERHLVDLGPARFASAGRTRGSRYRAGSSIRSGNGC